MIFKWMESTTITRTADLDAVLNPCLEAYQSHGLNQLIVEVNKGLLQTKIKFPLLEKAAHRLYRTLEHHHQLDFCQHLADLQSIGGNVLIGILLQNRSENDPGESIGKAAEYIAQGAQWYVSDIIGERVVGYNLLANPDITLTLLSQYGQHPSKWVVRSLGAGSHYAIKKGLPADYATKVFQFLITLAQAKDHHIKTGIGWAAKTSARYHPEMVLGHQQTIENKQLVGQWFRTKVRIGLGRRHYDQTH